jgi:two-component system nitrogen regulation response regulator GlnG
LDFTGNKRHEAAVLLGYGRNTLTRKVNELSIDVMD